MEVPVSWKSTKAAVTRTASGRETRSVCLSVGLTHVSVSHHALGPASQVRPHVGHQLVELLHRKGHVVLVGVAVVRQRLRDAFAHRPQSLRDRKTHWNCQCKYFRIAR